MGIEIIEVVVDHLLERQQLELRLEQLLEKVIKHIRSECNSVKTKLNKDMDKLLNYLVNKNIIIGIVTNKHSRYVSKIIEGLDLTKKLSCVITGDMVLNAKPAIDGLIKAAEEIQCNVNEIVYVGDDERDIVAGRDAGMTTVAADFGFISADINVRSWNSDLIIYNALELKNYI